VPHLVVIAGPNGAGKTTAAPAILHGLLSIDDFVNVDVIAHGISGFNPGGAALRAGRVMLERLRELTARGADLAFETTLASRTFVPWIEGLRTGGYDFHLVYLWLPSANLAVARVRMRAFAGGHDVPDEIVRRRYHRGAYNFIHLYRSIADSWEVHNNTRPARRSLVAHGRRGESPTVYDDLVWGAVIEEAGRETREAKG